MRIYHVPAYWWQTIHTHTLVSVCKIRDGLPVLHGHKRINTASCGFQSKHFAYLCSNFPMYEYVCMYLCTCIENFVFIGMWSGMACVVTVERTCDITRELNMIITNTYTYLHAWYCICLYIHTYICEYLPMNIIFNLLFC